jgi:hypothetical protein
LIGKLDSTVKIFRQISIILDELSSNISIQVVKGKPMTMPLWLARIIAKFGDLLGNKAPLKTN